MSDTIDNQGTAAASGVTGVTGASGASQRPFFGYYNPPPEAIASEEGPWVVAGVTLLLNTALTIAAVQVQPNPLPAYAWVLYVTWSVMGLLGLGLILGSEACRWLSIGLVLLASGLMTLAGLSGQVPGTSIKVDPATTLISTGLSAAGWLLMLVRNPRVGHSVGGVLLVIAAHGVRFYGSSGSMW